MQVSILTNFEFSLKNIKCKNVKTITTIDSGSKQHIITTLHQMKPDKHKCSKELHHTEFLKIAR